jgi:hypothetical protein
MASETQNFVANRVERNYTSVATSSPFYTNNSGGGGYWTLGTVKIELTNSTDVPYNQVASTRVSARTPGFKSKNRPNPLLPQPFSFTYEKYTQSGVRTVDTNYGGYANLGPGSSSYEYTRTYSTNQPQTLLPDETGAWSSQLIEKAIARLLDNIKDMNFNAAQAAGERKQTADLVASTATRIAKSYSSLRKGNFAKAASDLGLIPKKKAGRRFAKGYAADQAKAVGNAWLELTYGWKPLLSDVYGAVETLAKSNNRPNRIFIDKSGSAKRQATKTRKDPSAVPFGELANYMTITDKCQVKYKVTFSVTSAPVNDLAKLGISNPALLAWELLPYSFVVDWFLPIGGWLNSLDATNGLAFEKGFVTVFRESVSTGYKIGSYRDNQNGLGKHYYQYSQAERKIVNVTRTRLAAFPQRPFPSFKNPLSNSHVASAMALLLQTFKR